MLWVIFSISIFVMLLIDLGVFSKKKRSIGRKKAIIMSSIWIGLALLFNFLIYIMQGPHSAMQFLTGYAVEKMLSIDNLFLFVMIFTYFQVPKIYQHKILFLGIAGALIMRLLFIFLGAYLLQHFAWIIYIFGAFLLWIGLQFLRKQKSYSIEESKVFLWIQKILPVTLEYHGGKFFIRKGKILLATPLFLALIMIELTDFVAAIDSIPAIFVITTDTFIVYTSNIFAILGLRSLYFVISGAMEQLRYLYIGLSIVLLFLGSKILVSPWVKIPMEMSLSFVILIIGLTIFTSLKANHKEVKK